MITAIKPKYDFKTKTYSVAVIADANVLLAHEGFLVFDDHLRAYRDIKSGRLLGHWKEAKRVAVLAWLRAWLEANEASDDEPLNLD